MAAELKDAKNNLHEVKDCNAHAQMQSNQLKCPVSLHE